MTKTLRIKDGKIIVHQVIEITDYAILLKYDGHLYNLPRDVRATREKGLKNYLKKALELFAENVTKAKPNKRVDLFGNHSVYYYLYGHTNDWVVAAEKDLQFEKDLLTCISGDSIERLFTIFRQYGSQVETQEQICKSFNVQPSSVKRIVQMNYNQLAGIEEEMLASYIKESEDFLKKISELAQFEKETAL